MLYSLKPASPRRLFLHIGYPKTGTSSIQRAFFNERDYLEEAEGLLNEFFGRLVL